MLVSIPFPPLIKGTLIRRYKRFLADVLLEDGSVVTCHNTNTGSMLSCSESGREVYLSNSQNTKRKYPLTWEMIRMENTLVGVNTMLPNKLAEVAFQKGKILGLKGPSSVKREVSFGRSRLDLLITTQSGEKIYVEVKNCTYVEEGRALFPDAKSQRASKHLLELSEIVKEGHRAIILIMVARSDATHFSPADKIDPFFGECLRNALNCGVELKVHTVLLSLKEALLGPKMPFILEKNQEESKK
jgi:sugar fermentation stimulation protein A